MFSYEYHENFKISQYEDIAENGKFCFREHIDARYILQEQPQYRRNILIEALPPIKDDDNTFDFLKKFPVYSEEERFYPDEYRIHAIFRLLDYMLPISSNLLSAEALSIVIRNGYMHKKVGTPEYMRLLKKANDNLVKGEKNVINLATKSSIASNSSTGFLVIGASGCGKTTGMNNCLSYYPQVIHHLIDYKGNKSFFTQVPWVRVDCSFDGRISGVCNYFFQELDELLGTNYSNQYGGKGTNIDKMINSISFLALKYAIGVLVVDEIQFIRHTNNGESLFNFFVTLMNTIKIPIIFIGTYKAVNTILGEQYAKGRKSEGIGGVEYFRLEKNDESEWNTFIETLWNYQWLKNKIPLTEEINDLIHKCSLGIIDRVNKLFMAVQLEAIRSGEEMITAELIEKVSNERFKLTDKVIKEYKSGDKNEISKFDDIIAPDLKLEDYINRNRARKKINEIYNSDKFKENINKQQTIDTIICIMNKMMDYKKEEIENVVIAVVNKIGFDKDTSILIREVSKELAKIEMNSQKNKDVNDNNTKLKKGSKKQTVPDNFLQDNFKDIFDGIGQ